MERRKRADLESMKNVNDLSDKSKQQRGQGDRAARLSICDGAMPVLRQDDFDVR